MSDWVQVTVDVPPGLVDLVAGDLWASGIGGLEESVTGDGSVRLVIGVESAALGAAIEALSGHDLVPTVHPVAEDEGLDGWRDFAVPHVVGRVALIPEWWDGPATSVDLLEIRLDAGRSFGHGGHVTTQLALLAIQDLELNGASILDVGCGSGVLTIGAALFGATRVVGVDPAADAVRAARDNVARNGVDDVVGVRSGSVEVAADLPDVDVVVANIEAPVLEELAPQIAGLTRSGGRVVLSGFLATQADRVLAAYRVYADFDIERRIDEGDWSAVVLTRH